MGIFISYAQNFEDVMLWRALKHVKNGFYIDVGAQDPVIDSVSLAFYERGWRGVHIEPTSHYAGKLRHARIDETLIQAAVGSKSGVLKLFEITNTGLSTGNPQIAEKHRASGFGGREIDVPCLTLASILDEYSDREIHWLKIDVEGMEDQVLQSWLPSSVRPWVLVVESTLPLMQVETHEHWESLFLELAYDPVYFDGLNRFYVSKTHPELKDAFRNSPNVFDDFALSGTASAPFCSVLTGKLDAQQQEVQRLADELEAQQTDARRLTQTLAEREREIAEEQSRLQHSREEAKQLAEALIQREQELSAQIQRNQEEAQRLAAALASVYASRCAHPRRKALVIRLVAHWPRLFAPIRAFSARRIEAPSFPPDFHETPTTETNGSIDWNAYPSSVRHNYTQLMTACAQARAREGTRGA